MWKLICILLSAIFLLLIILVFKSRRKIMLANRIPGPTFISLIDLIRILIMHGQSKLFLAIHKIYRINEEQSMFKIWLLDNLHIILTRPEEIKFALTNPKLQMKSKEYTVLQESIMGEGIFSCGDVKKWKSNRKIVTGGFSFTMIKSFIPIFYEEANVLAKILQRRCNSELADDDISDPISKATMDMIGRTAFGIRFNAQENDRNRYIENLHIVMQTWEYRILHPWLLSRTLYRFSSMKRKHDRSQKIINEFADEIISRKFAELQQNESNTQTILETETDEDTSRKNKTFIDILLEHHIKISHKQVRDEIITIIIGGQETTTFSNACVIFMLAHHQDIQNKVFEELQLIFSNGDSERQPTYEDLLNMEYLECVIKETLRHYPSLPIFSRKLKEETQIGKYLCPAGASVTVVPLLLHKSPLHYPDKPDEFDPDRFLPNASEDRHPYSFLPFSAGTRNCVGSKYAMFQMKTVVSTLVRKFRFSPSDRCPTPERLRLMFLTTLKFVNGCPVKIEHRTMMDNRQDG